MQRAWKAGIISGITNRNALKLFPNNNQMEEQKEKEEEEEDAATKSVRKRGTNIQNSIKLAKQLHTTTTTTTYRLMNKENTQNIFEFDEK